MALRPRTAACFFRHRNGSTEIFETADDNYNIVTTLIQLGRVCAALGDTEDAEAAWRQALQLCRVQQRRNDVANLKRLLD